MDLLSIVDHHAAYDQWANARIAERLATEPDSVLDAPLKSSFPSLRATLMHIRDAECVWRQRSMGEQPTWPADASTAIGTFMQHVDLLRAHVRGLATSDLLAEISYQDLRGNTHVQPRWQALMHCFNHSTYHRGQLVTMMRMLDLGAIPQLDLVVYQRLMEKGAA